MSWIITYPPEYYLKLGGHSSIVPTETRYIATLKASEGGYIKLAQPIEVLPDDDFELVFSYFTSDEFPVSNNRFIAGGDGGSGTPDTFAIYLDKSTGSVSLQIPLANSTNAYVSLTPAAVSNIFNTVTLKRVANNLTLTCGNVTKTVTLAQTLALKITNLAKWGGVAKFNGSYLAFKLWTGGDSSTGQKVIDYDFDAKHGTTIIPNLAQPLGSELVDFTRATGRSTTLTDISTNAVTVTNNIAEYGTTEQVIDFEEGTYLLQVKSSDNSAHSSGGAFTVTPNNWTDKIFHSSLQNGDNTLIFNVPSAGSYKVWFHVGANNLGESQIFSDVSIKKAPNWAEYINVTDDNKELYTFDEQRNAWVGNDTGNVLEVAQ